MTIGFHSERFFFTLTRLSFKTLALACFWRALDGSFGLNPEMGTTTGLESLPPDKVETELESDLLKAAIGLL